MFAGAPFASVTASTVHSFALVRASRSTSPQCNVLCVFKPSQLSNLRAHDLH